MKTGITVDEWIKELSVLPRISDGFTTRELAKITGLSTATMFRRIGAQIAKGNVVLAGTKMEPTIAGVLKPSPVYRLVKKSRKK